MGMVLVRYGGNKRWLRDFTEAKCDKLHNIFGPDERERVWFERDGGSVP